MHRTRNVKNINGINFNHLAVSADSCDVDIYMLPPEVATATEAGYARVEDSSSGYMGMGEGWYDISLEYYKFGTDALRKFYDKLSDIEALEQKHPDLETGEYLRNSCSHMKSLHTASKFFDDPDYPSEYVDQQDETFSQIIADRQNNKTTLLNRLSQRIRHSSPSDIDSRLMDTTNETTDDTELIP